MSIGPTSGRGTAVPSSVVPPTQSSFTSTASKNRANASVDSASHTSPRRSTGNASSMPTSAATAPPTSAPASTDTSHRSASCIAVNAPTAANDAWASEICPPSPVNTVTDRKITPKITASVITVTQKSSAPVSVHTASRPNAAHKAPVSTRRAAARSVAAPVRQRGPRPRGATAEPARRRVDGGERVAVLAAATHRRQQHDHGEQDDERQRRADLAGEQALGVEERGELGGQHAEAEPARQRPRDAREPADGGRGDGHHDELEVGGGLDGREARRQQDARQPCEQARQHPRPGRHGIGVDPPLRRHPRARTRPPASPGPAWVNRNSAASASAPTMATPTCTSSSRVIG